MDCYIGIIFPWAVTYPPRNFMFCEGQILPISEYGDLFAVIGSQYGGNGRNTFALPDLRGCFPIGAGQNPRTGRKFQPGERYDSTMQVSLQTSNLPAHNHSISNKVTNNGNTSSLSLSLDIEIPVNTDMNPSPTNVNIPKDNTLAVGKTSGPMQANIYTGNGPTGNDTLKPFTVEKDIDVPVPDIEVTSSCTNTGSGVPINIAPPHLCVNYIICVKGIFPPRG